MGGNAPRRSGAPGSRTVIGRVGALSLAAAAVLGIPAAAGERRPAADDGGYLYGHIGRQRFRIPRHLVLSTVTSEQGPSWVPVPPQANRYTRPIRFFDLLFRDIFAGPQSMPVGEATLNTRGFVEADAVVVPADRALGDAAAALASDLAGTGLSGRFAQASPIAGMRHWMAVAKPNSLVAPTDLFLDDRHRLALRCTGGALVQVRGRGLCTMVFAIMRHRLSITASFSGADLADAPAIKRAIENAVASFTV